MAKKNKVPKTLFAAPVPKTIRRSHTAQYLFGNPLGRQILAGALVAAAGAAAVALSKTRAAQNARRTALAGGTYVKDALQNAALAAGDAIVDAKNRRNGTAKLEKELHH